MYLRNLISNAIKSAKLYDKNGNLIDNKTLENEFNAIKNYLLNNYSSNDMVAINFEKDYRYVLMVFASMYVGVTFIPLNKDWPQKRVEQIQDLSGCVVITEDSIDFNNTQKSSKYFENEILYVLFTSGSTGAPKGVKIKRESYDNFVNWINDYFSEINSQDRMLMTTDFTFDIFLVDMALFLTKNLSLFISSFNNNIFKMLYEIEKYKITTHSTVPYNYSMIMGEGIYEKANLSTLKYIILAGARFPNNLYHNFKDRIPNCSVYNAYGPTEGTIYVSCHKMTYNEDIDIYKNSITIGKPLYNTEFRVVDDELLIASKQLMKEYLNNPQKTKEVLVEIDGKTYYKSGDVVLVNDDSNYFIVGRKDDTIKTAGFRVNLSDIDSYILGLDYINNVATIAIESEGGENDLVCYVILNQDNITPKEIKKDLKDILPYYQIPKTIKIVNEFPLNNSGKICKKTLKSKFLEEKEK